MNKKIKIITTLGPATKSEEDLRKIKDKGVDFVRINMSHSTIEDLKYFIALAKKVGIPFIIDTEGSQIRTGDLSSDSISLEENDEIKIYSRQMAGNKKKISLRPSHIIGQLELGDIMYVDFDALILVIFDVSTIKKGYVMARAINSGKLGKNKGVVIDSALDKKFELPVLSKKDYQSIEVGLDAGTEYIAASFMRTPEFVEEVRRATEGKMKIISKIECLDALENLDEIIKCSDYLLFDRGDMSKEVSIEKIPLLQKILLDRADKQGKGVFVATNLLETMVEKSKPTRAEVHDVIATILDGAHGLTLSAETAIGKYPMECVNMINNLIQQAQLVLEYDKSGKIINKNRNHIMSMNDFMQAEISSTLITPHGGKLIERILKIPLGQAHLESLESIQLNQNLQMDVEQIAIGSFSPIEGFMNRQDLAGVLDNMRLTSGDVWTIPIILDITEEQADKISIGDEVVLNGDDGPLAILYVEDKYAFDKEETAKKLYESNNDDHPGVRWIRSLNPILLGGKIDLIKRRNPEFQEYTLTPRQVRRLFNEKNWSTVVGFHTRNVIHRSHEFIQLKAMTDAHCDGLFIHPVVGKKKAGDFHARYIIEGYKEMVNNFYPPNKVVFATFSTFSRYAGPREAVFTALCRKNFGCSHFIVGRDHTGVGDFYHPHASHDIFDKFDDLGIIPIKFDKVFYSKKLGAHIHEKDSPDHSEDDKLHISGTQARKMFEKQEVPPSWFMRPEISKIIIDSVAKGDEVFVKEEGSSKNAGKVVWLTGLSGSGKTTIAEKLKEQLGKKNKKTIILDGDTIRRKRDFKLDFSREGIRKNNKLIAEEAVGLMKDYDFVLIPVIAPYSEDRKYSKKIIGSNFLEVYINCPLEELIDRDTKGLYAKAQTGEIDNLIGFNGKNPYEAPQKPDLEINTQELDIKASVEQVYKYLTNN